MGVKRSASPRGSGPSAAQRRYLERGLREPGGKLPLFDRNGREIDPRTVRSCIERAWAAPWFDNPLKPDWLICKLTPAGLAALAPGALDESDAV
ncbi:hypothetical protein GGR25_003897 [Kaistia hirudinis]|uniref:Uncharacterized protein n=1 Tax=Kaistia hirudinis TaxID=1293440 RepID=A0A840AUD4_9HYPH|nr:hypothetical protein [Kaistia hirudinis]MBB3932833.1 hypothetical protein [Kaistia hirudinis]